MKVDLAVCHALEAENDDLRLRLQREVAVPFLRNRHSGINETEASNLNAVFSNSSNSSGGRSKLVYEETPGEVDVSAMLAILFRRAEELKDEMYAARKPTLAFLQRPHCIGHKPYEEVELFEDSNGCAKCMLCMCCCKELSSVPPATFLGLPLLKRLGALSS